MDDKDVQAMKEEMAQLSTSVANISGCLDNFDTTLNNHMTDYKKAQDEMRSEQTKIRDAVTALGLVVAKIQGSEGLAIILIKWVIVPLIVILAGLIGVKLIMPGGTI
jgi:t-SNARE complex subunit (syntaxin)